MIDNKKKRNGMAGKGERAELVLQGAIVAKSASVLEKRRSKRCQKRVVWSSDDVTEAHDEGFF